MQYLQHVSQILSNHAPYALQYSIVFCDLISLLPYIYWKIQNISWNTTFQVTKMRKATRELIRCHWDYCWSWVNTNKVKVGCRGTWCITTERAVQSVQDDRFPTLGKYMVWKPVHCAVHLSTNNLVCLNSTAAKLTAFRCWFWLESLKRYHSTIWFSGHGGIGLNTGLDYPGGLFKS